MSKTNSGRRKIISLVMSAVMILLSAVSMEPNMLVNGAGEITSSTTTSSVISNGTSGSTTNSKKGIAKTDGVTLNYTYTGEVITSSASVYDYVSDDELDGNAPNSIASGYSDPYTRFNTAISEDGSGQEIDSPSSENITFYYKAHNGDLTNVRIYLFDKSGNNIGWPGKTMNYDSLNDVYVYTFKYDELGFTPTAFLLNGADLMGAWQTDDINCTLQKGKSYTYYDCTETNGTTNQLTLKIRKDTARAVKFNGSANSDGLHLRDDGGIKANLWDGTTSGTYTMISSGDYWQATINVSSYKSEFYVTFKSEKYYDKDGNPWRGSVETDAYKITKGKNYTFDGSNTIVTGTALDLYKKNCRFTAPLYFGCFYRGDSASDYTSGNKADYTNFFWQANMSLRGNIDASVQGLVDSKLNEDGKLTQNGEVLPYFDETWVSADSSRAGLINSYTDLLFPFYGIKVNAANVKGDDNATGYAKYYQFNSKEVNLFLDTGAGQFRETNVPIHSQATASDPSGTVGYYPFNDIDDNTKNNLGFGTRFDIQFKLRSDGKVETMDEYGSGTNTFVDAMFEFVGDDDVWVFIDGKLILDLGGAHKDTTGVIDFATKEAYANHATEFGGLSGNDKDNLGASAGSVRVDLRTAMTADTFDAAANYDEDKTHTLTMFYMERGMFESDLLVRYNFSTLTNHNYFTVREITSFTGVNPGILEATKKAADYDVFQYQISNNGSEEGDESGIVTPVYDTYVRENQGLKAQLTGQEAANALYLVDKSGNGNWANGRNIVAWVWREASDGTGYDGKVYLAEKNDNVYTFGNIPEDANMVEFLRCGNGVSAQAGSTTKPTYSNIYKTSCTAGDVFGITGYGPTGTNLLAGEYIRNDKYQTHHFIPDTSGLEPVKTTNYLWRDEFAAKTAGTDNKPMAGTTDGNGLFYLMYGTKERKSSAEFQKQFVRDSVMKVLQMESLKTPARTENTTETFAGSLGRNVGTYYTTTINVIDREDKTVTLNATDKTFIYNNTETVSGKEPVQITEIFTNTPKLGAITIKKELAHGDTVNDEFTMKLELKDVFGVQGVTIDNYEDIEANVDIDENGTFVIKGGQTVTIAGIPYGTKYRITETNTGANYTKTSSTNTDFEQVFEGQINGTISTNENNNETIVNTRRTGNLILDKELAGDYETGDETDTFIFNVTLTGKAGVDLSQYVIGISSGGTLGTYNAATRSYTFPVSIVAGTNVTISGIPYETTYTVSEVATASEKWQKSSESNCSGTISAESVTATITNTYTDVQTACDIVLAKYVDMTDGTLTESQYGTIDFEFEVTLTNLNDGSGKKYSEYKAVFVRDGVTTETTLAELMNLNASQANAVAESANFVVTLNHENSFRIKDLPVNAGYHVKEKNTNAMSYIASYTVAGNSGSNLQITNQSNTAKFTELGLDATEIVDSADEEITITFTNKYVFTPYELPAAGMEDYRLVYTTILTGLVLFGLTYYWLNRKEKKI